jgi:NAD(P)-dependent dehydrogenase (short-subunit alcohol dehydrogenase family)
MPSKQEAIHSGFNAKTTAAEALGGADLRDKIAIVTGGYSGIGLETTRVLAQAGAVVIVPARTPVKAQKALANIPNVEQGTLDLLEPASITAFAENFIKSGRPLHILVNNAGIMATPLTRDKRGYETQFSANHLGHFQLTVQLLPALRKAHGARVVAVSSAGHRFGGINFEDPNFNRRDYDKWQAYGQSKTANILFALALDKREETHNIRAFSLHPGRIFTTDLKRELTQENLRAFGVVDEQGNMVFNPNHKTVEEGAATSIWCAANSQLDGMGGVYCANSDISPLVPADSQDEVGLRPWATDTESAENLWKLSEELTGTKFHF